MHAAPRRWTCRTWPKCYNNTLREAHAVLDLEHHDGDAESPSETGKGVGDPLIRGAAVVREVYAEHDDVVGG